jgi:hypothetical protein
MRPDVRGGASGEEREAEEDWGGAEGKKPRLDGGGAGVGLSAEVETQAMTVSQANGPSSSAAHRSNSA